MKNKTLMSCVLVAATALSGCATSGQGSFNGITSQVPGRVVLANLAQIKNLDSVMACVQPYTKGMRVALGPTMDSTGKTNSVEGTGNWMPGAQSGDAAIPLLLKAGMIPVNLNSLNAESNLRGLVTAEEKLRMQQNLTKYKPQLVLDTTAISLDFDRTTDFKLMVKGIGGLSEMQRATLSGGAKLVSTDGTLTIHGSGRMKMSVFSTQNGLSLGRVFGNTLAVGETSVSFQQPMQLWTVEYVISITTARAITRLPGIPASCGQMIDKFIQDDIVTI